MSERFANWTDKTAALKRPWLTAVLFSGEREYWNKLGFQFHGFTSTWEDLSTGIVLSDLDWPNLDLNEIRSSTNAREIKLSVDTSHLSATLAALDRPAEFPDYGGSFLHSTGEALLSAGIDGLASEVGEMFPAYFAASLLKFNQLRPAKDVIDWRFENEVKIAIAPLLDLMDISGYLLLLAEFHNKKRFWDTPKTAWDAYFDLDPDQNFGKLFAGVLSMANVAFEVSHRSLIRSNWQQRISGLLAELPRRPAKNLSIYEDRTVPEHNSPLVRAFAARDYGLGYDGISAFTALYLCGKFPDFDATSFYQVRSLLDAVDYQKNGDD